MVQLTLVSLVGLFHLGWTGPIAQAQPAGEARPSEPALGVLGERPILQSGSRGTYVSELQALLKLLGYYSGPVDGFYQQSTMEAVTAFQAAAGLASDGIVGPSTWDRLLPSASAINSSSPASGGETGLAPDTSPAPSTSASSLTAQTSTATASSPPPAASAQPESSGPSSPTASQTNPPSSGAGASSSATPPTSVDFPVLRMGVRGPAVSRLQERLRSLRFYSGPIDGIFGSDTQNAVKAAQRNFNLEPDGVVGPATWSALLR